MASYLPPVVARLTADIGDFVAKVETAKALLDDLGGDHLANVDVNDEGLARATAAEETLRGAAEEATAALGEETRASVEKDAAQSALSDSIERTSRVEFDFAAALELGAHAIDEQRIAAEADAAMTRFLADSLGIVVDRLAMFAVAASYAADSAGNVGRAELMAGQMARSAGDMVLYEAGNMRVLAGSLDEVSTAEARLGGMSEYAVTVLGDQSKVTWTKAEALAALNAHLTEAFAREQTLAITSGVAADALDKQARTTTGKATATAVLNEELTALVAKEEVLALTAGEAATVLEGQARTTRDKSQALRGLSGAAATAAAAEAAAGKSASDASVRFYGFWATISRIYNAMAIPLFANAFEGLTKAIFGADAQMPKLIDHLINTSVAWHTVMEAVMETVAVWVPAIISFGAYSAAAVPTVRDIATQLTHMYTASEATGQSFQSLATSGQNVVNAVKPSVMELFGEALYAVQQNSGSLAPVLASLGQGLDQIGARAINAMHSTGQFMEHGKEDVLGLFNAFGSLFGIFGNIMRVVPGYAEVLLQFGNDFLHVAEIVTGNNWVQDILKSFMALHGAIFYGGLFGTAVAFMFSKIVSGATAAAEGVAGLAIKMGLITSESGVVDEALGRVLLTFDELSAGTVIGGIALLAGAIAAVVMYLRASRTAAQGFNADMQKMISNASVLSLQNSLNNALTQTEAKYKAAASAAAQYASQGFTESAMRGRAYTSEEQAANRAYQATNQYRAGVQQIQGQLGAYHSNIAAIARALHVDVPQALQIANGAQITSNQLTKSGAANLQEMIIEAQGYEAQLRVMTVGSGQLNSALNALNVTSSDQVTNMQKVTQAFSTWMGIVTGADSQFTTFEQGITQLGEAMSSAGTKATLKTGQLSDKINVQNAALDGTSAASLAARQAFDQEIQAGSTLIGNMQMQAAAAGNSAVANHALAQAGKDVIAQLLPMAAGSREAQAMVFALAQTAGYAGSNSLSSLSKWAGNAKKAEGDLNRQQAILTITTADLSQAARNLASGLSGVVTQAMVNAIANTSSLNQSTQGLVNAFNSAHGKINADVNDMAVKYAQTLKGMGFSNQQIEGALDALGRHFGMSKGQAATWSAEIVNDAHRAQAAINAMHGKSINVTTTFTSVYKQIVQGGGAAPREYKNPLTGPVTGGWAKGTPSASRGWAWVGENGPELVRFSGGETVIPNHVATGYAGGAGDFSTENHVHVHLDGREIYKSVQKSAVSAQRRTGTNGLTKRTR